MVSEKLSFDMHPDRAAERVRRLRRALGFSSSTMADHLQIARSAWSRFERGHRVITIPVAAILYEQYGVTLDFLIYGNESGMPKDLIAKMNSLIDKSR